jgi:hypothetical protein
MMLLRAEGIRDSHVLHDDDFNGPAMTLSALIERSVDVVYLWLFRENDDADVKDNLLNAPE